MTAPRWQFRKTPESNYLKHAARDLGVWGKYVDPAQYASSKADLRERQRQGQKLELYQKGVNPMTVNMVAKVFPYGGGMAPARILTKQELTARYLGSRATGRIIAAYQYENGMLGNTPDSKEVKKNIDNIRRELVVGWENEDMASSGFVPMVPYPVVNRDRGGNVSDYHTGTLADAVLQNRDWWNENLFRHDAVLGELSLEPGKAVRSDQGKLTQDQINHVWKYAGQKYIYNALGENVLHQPLTKDREVPKMGVYTPEIRQADGSFEPATHGFDWQGNINSARNQELMQYLDEESRKGGGEKLNRFIKEQQELVREERIVRPNWYMQLQEETHPVDRSFDELMEDSSIWVPVNNFWQGGLENHSDLDPEERANSYYKWRNEQNRNGLTDGVWETNYMNPEFEPGMWSHPDYVEYRTLGVQPLVSQRILQQVAGPDNPDITSISDIDKLVARGVIEPMNPQYLPEDATNTITQERTAALNSMNSPTAISVRKDYYNKIREGVMSGKLSEDKMERSFSALHLIAPSENQANYERAYTEDYPNVSLNEDDQPNLARQQWAENIDPDYEYQLREAVTPLKHIDDPKAVSLEDKMRADQIWKDYIGVSGNQSAGFTLGDE